MHRLFFAAVFLINLFLLHFLKHCIEHGDLSWVAGGNGTNTSWKRLFLGWLDKSMILEVYSA